MEGRALSLSKLHLCYAMYVYYFPHVRCVPLPRQKLLGRITYKNIGKFSSPLCLKDALMQITIAHFLAL
jgi:hypothetical protein